MIREAIKYVEDDLNDFINRKQGSPFQPPLVMTSVLMSQDGSFAVNRDQALIMTLVNIQEEKVTGPGSTRRKLNLDREGRLEERNTYFDLNLFLLLSAIFPEGNKMDDLHIIRLAIEFFQGKPYFDATNSPGLPDQISKLSFEIQNLDFMQMSNLWGTIGAKQLPAVLYKSRLQYHGSPGLLDLSRGVAGSKESTN